MSPPLPPRRRLSSAPPPAPLPGAFSVRIGGYRDEGRDVGLSEAEAWQRFLTACQGHEFAELLRGRAVVAWLLPKASGVLS
jgi:hypothetical protein